MPRQLYPRPKPTKGKSLPQKNKEENKPYHVRYSDPDNPTATAEWCHYDSELGVRLGAWYNVKVLGFNTAATMYDQREYKELDK